MATCSRTDDRATELARQARRAGLTAALRGRPDLRLDQLIRLVLDSKYANDLQALRVEELAPTPHWIPSASRHAIEPIVLRVFRATRGEWLSSGFFVRYLGIKRWTAQKICGELAARGVLDRCGRTSATRYRLTGDHQERNRGAPL